MSTDGAKKVRRSARDRTWRDEGQQIRAGSIGWLRGGSGEVTVC